MKSCIYFHKPHLTFSQHQLQRFSRVQNYIIFFKDHLTEYRILSYILSFSSPEPIASFSRRRLGTRHEGLWRHTIPEVLDSSTSGIHVWVIKFILNTVKNMAALQQSGRNHIRRVIQSFSGLPSRGTELGTIKNIVFFTEERSLKKFTSFGKSLIFQFTLFLAWCSEVPGVKSGCFILLVSPLNGRSVR